MVEGGLSLPGRQVVSVGVCEEVTAGGDWGCGWECVAVGEVGSVGMWMCVCGGVCGGGCRVMGCGVTVGVAVWV